MKFRTIITTSASIVLAASATPSLGQELSPELQAFDAQIPGSLSNDPTDLVWQTQGPLDVEGVQDDSIPGGGAARRYQIDVKSSDIWASQTYIPLLTNIAREDVMTVGFYARTIAADTDDGTGVIGVRFQQNAAPYAGFADTTLSIGKDWDWYEVSGTATTSIDRGEANVVLQLAGAKQTVEIGQAIVVKGAAAIVGSAPKATEAEPAAPSEEPLVPEPLANAGTLLNQPNVRNWETEAVVGTIEDREEPAIWLGRATRFSLSELGENDWDLVAGIPIEQAIAAGDKLLVAIAAKTVSADTPDGHGVVAMRIQDKAPPYDGFAGNVFKVGQSWQLIRINITAPRDLPAGSVQLALQFAAEAQSIDVGPVYIFKTD